jgi:hypothetical protein
MAYRVAQQPTRARRGTCTARGHRAVVACGGGLVQQAASSRATRCGGTSGDSSRGMRGGARQGETGVDAPRWRRDDRVERSARDGGVPVEGGSDDRRRVRRGPGARGGQGVEEMVVD